MKYATIALLLTSAPALAGGWAEPVYPPAFEIDWYVSTRWCEVPVISERTGDVLYWTRRAECAGEDAEGPTERPKLERPATPPGNTPEPTPEPEKPEPTPEPEKPEPTPEPEKPEPTPEPEKPEPTPEPEKPHKPDPCACGPDWQRRNGGVA